MVLGVLLLLFLIGYISFCTVFHKVVISSHDDSVSKKIGECIVSVLFGWLFTPTYLASFLAKRLKRMIWEKVWRDECLKKLKNK